MSRPSDLHIEVASDPCELADVRHAIEQWAGAHAWPEDDIAHLALAVDEALTNVIRHGYEGCAANRILVDVRAVSDPVRGVGVEIEVRDFGKQVDPERIAGRDLDDVRPGGLGVHIIRSVMDSVTYSRAEDCGMRLVMRKYPTTGGPPKNPSTTQPERP